MIKDRIIELIEYKNLKKEDFYRSIGMTSANFRGKAKETPLNSLAIENILTVIPDVNVEWLLTGKGNMLKKNNATSRCFIAYDTTNKSKWSEPESLNEQTVFIPVIDASAAAGHGFLNQDHPEELGKICLPENMLQNRYGKYFCGRVCGESMSPTLLHNDFIVFRLLENTELITLVDNEIYFIVDRDGNAYVKRIENLLSTKQKIRCISDNLDKQNYRDFYLEAYDIANIFHVEWKFSNNLECPNRNVFAQLASIENRLDVIEQQKIKH